jgi:hypothetical protein
MAETLGVCATGGSDCHGAGRDGMLLGRIKLPYERVEALRHRTTPHLNSPPTGEGKSPLLGRGEGQGEG